MVTDRQPLGALRLNFFSDPGHGWLAVSVGLLDDLGITERISAYSFWEPGADRSTSTAYLEEDADATLFANAMRTAGIRFTIHELPPARGDSHVRRLRNFPITV